MQPDSSWSGQTLLEVPGGILLGLWPIFILIVSFIPVEHFFQKKSFARASKVDLGTALVCTFPHPIDYLQTIFFSVPNLAHSFL